MDPKAIVRQGQWVHGPDGRRELDVVVTGLVDGRLLSLIVECKDFNPKTTGPVGIAYIDALVSKKADLRADVAIVCSNAGFTSDAIRKAKRVGIGLIAVLRKGDSRIRFQAVDEIYIRRVTIDSLRFEVHTQPPLALKDLPEDDICYNGLPIAHWIAKRAALFIGSNPIVRGHWEATFALKSPTMITIRGQEVEATRIDMFLSISGGWFVQQVAIDASAGFYDWIRRRVRLLNGLGQLGMGAIDFNSGEPIDRPPDSELEWPRPARKHEAWMDFLMIKGLQPKEPAPDLERLILPQDLVSQLLDIPIDAMTSGAAS
jgi:Restriction endonuclease